MRITEPYTIFLRTLKSGKQVYYYQFRNENGTRTPMYSTGTDKLTEARRICAKLYRDGSMKTNCKILFKTFAENFFSENSSYALWKKSNGTPVTLETLKAYEKFLKNQIMPFFSDLELSKINTAKIKEWVIWASEKWSSKTINNAQTVLNIIFNSASEHGYISKNPIVNIGFRKVDKKKRDLLTVQELNLLFNSHWTIENEKIAFLLAVVTGMRIGEVVALKQEDVHDNFLDVKHSLGRYGIGDTKTKVCRFVPVPKDFPFPKTDWLFDNGKGEPLKSHAVYNAFTRLCDKVGIERKERGITIHSLRNFFISYLQKENVPEPKIRAVVGHAEETMTDLYTYWKPDMFPEVYIAQEKLFKEIICHS